LKGQKQSHGWALACGSRWNATFLRTFGSKATDAEGDMTLHNPDPRAPGRTLRPRETSGREIAVPLIIGAAVLAIVVLWLLGTREPATNPGVVSRDSSPKVERPVPTAPPNQSPATAPKQ